MDISDILKKDEFRDLDIFLTQEMYRYAGDGLVRKMVDVLETEELARDWFYTPLKDGKRPYDHCRSGDVSEVEDLLARIEHGVYS